MIIDRDLLHYSIRSNTASLENQNKTNIGIGIFGKGKRVIFKTKKLP
jgi:hypothetical protein